MSRVIQLQTAAHVSGAWKFVSSIKELTSDLSPYQRSHFLFGAASFQPEVSGFRMHPTISVFFIQTQFEINN